MCVFLFKIMLGGSSVANSFLTGGWGVGGGGGGSMQALPLGEGFTHSFGHLHQSLLYIPADTYG